MRKHETENGIFVVSQMTEGISEVKKSHRQKYGLIHKAGLL